MNDDQHTDTDELPPELSAQLKKPRKFQKEVTAILSGSDKPLSTDEILIKLFQQYNLMVKRQHLKTQLWHLSEAGIIQSKHYGDAYSLPTPKKGKAHD